MVIIGTKIVASDNSGARFMECIKVLGSHQKKSARVGEKLIVAVKNAAQKKKIKIHDVCQCILLRTKKKLARKNGIFISFKRNSAVVIEKKRSSPIGTRIFGPYIYELRRKKYVKILSIASSII
jgi:large subunit ribosomal protein L14